MNAPPSWRIAARKSARAVSYVNAPQLAEERGVEVRVPESDAGPAGLDDCAVPVANFAKGLDLVLVLGGDGTMLRAVQLVWTDMYGRWPWDKQFDFDGLRQPVLGSRAQKA